MLDVFVALFIQYILLHVHYTHSKSLRILTHGVTVIYFVVPDILDIYLADAMITGNRHVHPIK